MEHSSLRICALCCRNIDIWRMSNASPFVWLRLTFKWISFQLVVKLSISPLYSSVKIVFSTTFSTARTSFNTLYWIHIYTWCEWQLDWLVQKHNLEEAILVPFIFLLRHYDTHEWFKASSQVLDRCLNEPWTAVWMEYANENCQKASEGLICREKMYYLSCTVFTCGPRDRRMFIVIGLAHFV